ncbi:hypothetical protein RUND412_001796 [Rhizina undulata]
MLGDTNVNGRDLYRPGARWSGRQLVRGLPLRRLAIRVARSTQIPAIARPLSTAFSPSTFTITNSRPRCIAELRSFESLLQRRWNSNGEEPLTKGQLPTARHTLPDGTPLAPTKVLYLGNIQFDVREDELKEHFSQFGTVMATKIIYDPRGLSRGFGYVEFETIEQAAEAIDKMHNRILAGRRLNVQYVARNSAGGSSNNPASSTLFIGNMSYEITDEDLNQVFKNIKNCVDVRVAMDRRTGQPRGFAHADFTDVESAVSAKEQLIGVELFGRVLRIDYASKPARSGGQSGGFQRSQRGNDRDSGRDRYQSRQSSDRIESDIDLRDTVRDASNGREGEDSGSQRAY